MGSERHPAWDQIESDVCVERDFPGVLRPGEHEIELSKAISLKRIADAIERWAAPCPPAPLCEHGLDVMDCLQCAPF